MVATRGKPLPFVTIPSIPRQAASPSRAVQGMPMSRQSEGQEPMSRLPSSQKRGSLGQSTGHRSVNVRKVPRGNKKSHRGGLFSRAIHEPKNTQRGKNYIINKLDSSVILISTSLNWAMNGRSGWLAETIAIGRHDSIYFLPGPSNLYIGPFYPAKGRKNLQTFQTFQTYQTCSF